MEEQTSSWEQPQNAPQTGEVEDTEEMAEEKAGSHGKFKDADTLLSAYNSLQAEFTRKCQRLSALEKQQEEQAKLSRESETKESTPLYERENWTEIVSDFLAKNDEAKAYSKEICSEIMNNPQHYKNDESLQLAYAKVLKVHMLDKSQALHDNDFVQNYILSSDEIKDRVMKIYLDELSQNAPPKVITRGMGEVFSKKISRPATLEEAKKLVQNLMEN